MHSKFYFYFFCNNPPIIFLIDFFVLIKILPSSVELKLQVNLHIYLVNTNLFRRFLHSSVNIEQFGKNRLISVVKVKSSVPERIEILGLGKD